MMPIRIILLMVTLAVPSALWANAGCLADLTSQASSIERYFDERGRAFVPFTEIPVTPSSLLAAHRTGYLPERGDVWEVPTVRGVVKLMNRGISKSIRKHIVKLISSRPNLRITFNHDPARVIEACALMERQSERWMTEEVVEGYKHLASLGSVFSAELWDAQGRLLAGNFGMVSNGHIQSMSKCRDLSDPDARSGIGHLLTEAAYYYFWSRGVSLVDVEVATIKGGQKKQGVAEMLDSEFRNQLGALNGVPFILFDGAIPGQPLPTVESDFIQKIATELR